VGHAEPSSFTLPAVEGLAPESVGQEGLVTVGHAEPSSFTLPIEVSELGVAGATSRQDEPLELHEETPRGVDRAEQEDVTILSAEMDFLAGVPDPLAAVDFYLNQGMEGEARSLLRRWVEINPGNTEAARYLALLESTALTEDATVGQEIEVIHLEPVEGVKGPPLPPAPLVEVEQIEKFEETRASPPPVETDGEKGVIQVMAKGQEIEVIHLEPVEGAKGPPLPPAPLVEVSQKEKSEEVRTVPPLVKPDGVKEVTPLMAKMEPPFVPAQEKGLGPADIFLDEYLDEPEVLRPVDRSPEDCEAHYQLGVAYQEMGLLDDAIAEFRRSATDERLRLLATNMVGLCLLSKGNVEAAIKEFRSGLEIVGRPAEEYLGIKYDLATAYQAMGDLAGAEALYRELEATSLSFRDVKSRLTKLQGRMSQGKGHPAAPKGRTDATRRTRSR